MASGGAFHNLLLAVLLYLALTSSVCTLITLFAAVWGPMVWRFLAEPVLN
jgi:hypothetical protein